MEVVVMMMAVGGGGQISVHVHKSLFFPHKKIALRGYAQHSWNTHTQRSTDHLSPENQDGCEYERKQIKSIKSAAHVTTNPRTAQNLFNGLLCKTLE